MPQGDGTDSAIVGAVISIFLAVLFESIPGVRKKPAVIADRPDSNMVMNPVSPDLTVTNQLNPEINIIQTTIKVPVLEPIISSVSMIVNEDLLLGYSSMADRALKVPKFNTITDRAFITPRLLSNTEVMHVKSTPTLSMAIMSGSPTPVLNQATAGVDECPDPCKRAMRDVGTQAVNLLGKWTIAKTTAKAVGAVVVSLFATGAVTYVPEGDDP